jgi:hypothetical protein
MAEDRANNPARVPNINTDAIYKSLEGKKNIASVSLPSRGDTRPGTGKWDFGGGRLQVSEYNEEELGPREMTKFDKTNKYHVGLLTAQDDSAKGMMLHPGGYFSFPKKAAPAETKPKAAPKKAVAPAPKVENKEVPDTKVVPRGSVSERDKVIAEKKAKSLESKIKGRAEREAAEAKRKKLLGLE